MRNRHPRARLMLATAPALALLVAPFLGGLFAGPAHAAATALLAERPVPLCDTCPPPTDAPPPQTQPPPTQPPPTDTQPPPPCDPAQCGGKPTGSPPSQPPPTDAPPTAAPTTAAPGHAPPTSPPATDVTPTTPPATSGGLTGPSAPSPPPPPSGDNPTPPSPVPFTPDSTPADTTPPTVLAAPLPPGVQAFRTLPQGLSIGPGDKAAAVGGGCDPNAQVTISVAGAQPWTARADARGDFTVDLADLNLDAGRHAVTASCGPVLPSAFIDVAVQTASAGTPGHTAALLLVIVFLVCCVAVGFRMLR